MTVSDPLLQMKHQAPCIKYHSIPVIRKDFSHPDSQKKLIEKLIQILIITDTHIRCITVQHEIPQSLVHHHLNTLPGHQTNTDIIKHDFIRHHQ